MKLKKLTAVLVAAAVLAGCSTFGPDGKKTTDKAATAGTGALIGGVIGALVAGGRGAVIGAAIGGGIGYVVALDAQKKELAEAQAGAQELATVQGTELKLSPTVYTQRYKDSSTGEEAEGLKMVSIPLPLHQMLDKRGRLTAKGVATVQKLQAVADKTGDGSLEIAIPENSKAATLAAISQAAPGAKVVLESTKTGVARIAAKPLDDGGNIKIVA